MRTELLKFLDKMEEGRDTAGCRNMAEELGPCEEIVYSNLKNEIVIGEVYVRVFNGLGGGREGVREIEDCGGFCAALLRYVSCSLKNSKTVEVGEVEEGQTTQEPKETGEGDLWHDVNDKRFVMSITALRLLVLVDGLVDEVLCKREHKGPAILLSLLELPQECASFDIGIEILNLMAPKAPFADAIAINNELWRLLRVLERKGEADSKDDEGGNGGFQSKEEGVRRPRLTRSERR